MRLRTIAVLTWGCAALPDHPQRLLATQRVQCHEAEDGDEIVFDCGGDFISSITFASYGLWNLFEHQPTARVEDLTFSCRTAVGCV